MKIVIWGAGRRGQSALEQIGREWVVAFLDSNERIIGKNICEIPVISFEEYYNTYYECPILICFADEDRGVEELNARGIRLWFRLSDCPGEYQEPNQRRHLFSYIESQIKCKHVYYLLGLNLFSIQFANMLIEQYKCKVIIIYDGYISEEMRNVLNNLDITLEKKNELDEIEGEKIICQYIPEKNNCRLQVEGWKDFFDCSDKIIEYHNKDIQRYRNIHQNEEVVIVATGPSLKSSDLDKLYKKGVLSIAVGEIWHIFSETKWRPDYFVKQDAPSQKLYGDLLDTVATKQAFIGDTYEPFWEKERTCLKYHVGYELAENRRPKFSNDFSKVAYFSHTVTYAALQLAFYMGFSTVFLLGVDCSYGREKENVEYGHFYSNAHFKATGYVKPVLQGYEKAREYAETHEKEIINLSRGGYLEVFEKRDFDSVFEE